MIPNQRDGQLGPTKTKRVISLHAGLLLLRGLDLGEGLLDNDTFVEQNWISDDQTEKLIEGSTINILQVNIFSEINKLNVEIRLELIRCHAARKQQPGRLLDIGWSENF